MKILSLRYKFILFTIASAFSFFGVLADKKKEVPPAPDIHAISKAENIGYPVVPEKYHKFIADYMLREAQNILKQGYKVETERNGEVIVVTIPASKLFLPNAFELEVSGQKLIEPFSAYLKTENRFKIIMAMHSDDTGSPSYLENLTGERLQAAMSFLENQSTHPEQIVGYAMASDEPIQPNSNIANRALNRRLEIYIIPGTELINQAAKR